MDISVSNIVKVIKKLLSCKSTGFDGISNKALKDSAKLIASSLSDLSNFSVSTKTYPDEWLKCNKLSLNTTKTEFMVFGTNNKLNQFDKSPVTTPYTLCCHKLLRLTPF